MREDILDDQRELVDRIASAGWQVTDVEVSVYESPWLDGDHPEATVTLTARKPYGDVEGEDNPYRLE